MINYFIVSVLTLNPLCQTATNLKFFMEILCYTFTIAYTFSKIHKSVHRSVDFGRSSVTKSDFPAKRRTDKPQLADFIYFSATNYQFAAWFSRNWSFSAFPLINICRRKMNGLPSEEERRAIAHKYSWDVSRDEALFKGVARACISSRFNCQWNSFRDDRPCAGCATSIVAVIKQSKKNRSVAVDRIIRDARKRAQLSTRDHPPEFIALEPAAIRFRSISNNLSRVLLFALWLYVRLFAFHSRTTGRTARKHAWKFFLCFS